VLHVTQTALRPFSHARVEAWVVDTSQFLARSYTDYFTALDIYAKDLMPICEAVHRWAAKYDCNADRDLKQLSCLAISLGHRFWQDPRFGYYVVSSIENRDMPRPQAVQSLVAQSTEWLGALWQDDTVQEFGERLCALILGGYPATSVNLKYVLPGHALMFSQSDEDLLLRWLGPRLPQAQYDHQRLSYICMALAFGTGWWKDPQYRNIAHAVSAHNTPEDLVNRILPMFRALP